MAISTIDDAVADLAQAVMVQLLRSDHACRWEREELERALDNPPRERLDEALTHLGYIRAINPDYMEGRGYDASGKGRAVSPVGLALNLRELGVIQGQPPRRPLAGWAGPNAQHGSLGRTT